MPPLRIVALATFMIVSGWGVYHLAAIPTTSGINESRIEPLFARSVKQMPLPETWPSGNHGVPHYSTMTALLTMAAESSRRVIETEAKASASPKTETPRMVRRAKRQKPVDTEEDDRSMNAYARGEPEPRWRSRRDDFRNRPQFTERGGRGRADRLPFFPFGGFEGR